MSLSQNSIRIMSRRDVFLWMLLTYAGLCIDHHRFSSQHNKSKKDQLKAMWKSSSNRMFIRREDATINAKASAPSSMNGSIHGPSNGILSGGIYKIRSKWGCPNDALCNAELSW